MPSMMISKAMPGFVYIPDCVYAVRYGLTEDSWYIKLLLPSNEAVFTREEMLGDARVNSSKKELEKEMMYVVNTFLNELASYIKLMEEDDEMEDEGGEYQRCDSYEIHPKFKDEEEDDDEFVECCDNCKYTDGCVFYERK